MESKGMKFARQMMEKMGWQDGKGLGLNQNGITEALKPSKKFDVSGLGHKSFNDFQWWDHAFNKAAQAFDVKISETEGPVVKKHKTMGAVSTKKQPNDKPVASTLTYGSFEKTGTLHNGVIESKTPTRTFGEEDYTVKLSDEELFKICGKRTAHKGARHGLTASGKLARIAQQEAEAEAKASTITTTAVKNKTKTKLRNLEAVKNQKLDEKLETKQAAIHSSANQNDLTLQSQPLSEKTVSVSELCSSKVRSKRKRSKDDNLQDLSDQHSPLSKDFVPGEQEEILDRCVKQSSQIDTSQSLKLIQTGEFEKASKKKKEHKKRQMQESLDKSKTSGLESNLEELTETIPVNKKQKKKKSKKNHAEFQRSPS